MVKGNSISKVVRDLINSDLSLQCALARGYGNYSAIARMLKPDVERSLGREVKLESIITAVKRARVSYLPPTGNMARVIANSVINLRTDIAKLSVEKTRRTRRAIRRILADLHPESFVQILEGVSAITLIFEQRIFDDVRGAFNDDEVLEEKRNLAAIMVHSPREIINTPGCTVAFYNPISRMHINIEETVSCYTDTIIVLDVKDVGRALSALMDLITEARKATQPEGRGRTTLHGWRSGPSASRSLPGRSVIPQRQR